MITCLKVNVNWQVLSLHKEHFLSQLQIQYCYCNYVIANDHCGFVGNSDIELILIKYFQFNCHHPSQHKCLVPRTFLDRAKNISSTDVVKLSEVQHAVDALKINGYTEQFIRSCQSTTAYTNQSQTNRGFVTLPYHQGF